MIVTWHLDDPIVWILIIGVVILLFGSNKIPQFARALGSARREFDKASKGLVSDAEKDQKSNSKS